MFHNSIERPQLSALFRNTCHSHSYAETYSHSCYSTSHSYSCPFSHITLLFVPGVPSMSAITPVAHVRLVRPVYTGNHTWRAERSCCHTSASTPYFLIIPGVPSMSAITPVAHVRLVRPVYTGNHTWRAQYVGYHTSSAHAVFLFIPAHAMFLFTQQHSSLTCTLSLTPTSQHLLISFQPRV